jgi:chromosome segregation ATPase
VHRDLLNLAIMLCEGVPLMAGNRKDRKVEKSDGFWYEIAACIAYNCRVLKGLIKEPSGIISSKTNETTYSSEMVSQVQEVSHQLIALTSQSIALGEQLRKLRTQLLDQRHQMSKLDTQFNIQNTDLDALKDQWSARRTQLSVWIATSLYMAAERSRFSSRVSYNMSTQNHDFSALRNDITAHRTALIAFQIKVNDFEKVMAMPLLTTKGTKNFVCRDIGRVGDVNILR